MAQDRISNHRLGVALSTWVRRMGRAIALSVIDAFEGYDHVIAPSVDFHTPPPVEPK